MRMPRTPKFKTKVPKPRSKPTGISSSFGAARPSMSGSKKNYAKYPAQDPMDFAAGGFGDLGSRDFGGGFGGGFK